MNIQEAINQQEAIKYLQRATDRLKGIDPTDYEGQERFLIEMINRALEALNAQIT